MAQLGFVGLGKMGGRVAKRLLDAEHSVIGYNRTRSKAQWLLDAGMQWHDDVATEPSAGKADVSHYYNEATTRYEYAQSMLPSTVECRQKLLIILDETELSRPLRVDLQCPVGRRGYD